MLNRLRASLALSGLLFVILSGCQLPQRSTAPIPWSDQIAAAEQAAHQRGADFVLNRISANGWHTQGPGEPDGTLEVNFEYIQHTASAQTGPIVDGPEGIPSSVTMHEVLLITMKDNTPLTSLKDFGQSSNEARPDIATNLGLIKISPREVFEATRSEGERHIGHPVAITSGDFSIWLGRGAQEPNNVGMPIAWLISYDKQDSTGAFSTLTLWVDVQTGATIKQVTE